MSQGLELYQIDAFTNEAFKGNPAGVCFLQEDKDNTWLQNFAAEMNLSETAYLKQIDGTSWSLRWFSPVVEVQLCGHATLASIHALFITNRLKEQEEVIFHTLSGQLKGKVYKESDIYWITMDFPAEIPSPQNKDDPLYVSLYKALGLSTTDILYFGKNRMDTIIVVDTEDKVHRLQPDFVELKKYQTRCVLVTCSSSSTHQNCKVQFY